MAMTPDEARERNRQKQAEWRARNPDRNKAAQRKWRAAHVELARARVRESSRKRREAALAAGWEPMTPAASGRLGGLARHAS